MHLGKFWNIFWAKYVRTTCFFSFFIIGHHYFVFFVNLNCVIYHNNPNISKIYLIQTYILNIIWGHWTPCICMWLQARFSYPTYLKPLKKRGSLGFYPNIYIWPKKLTYLVWPLSIDFFFFSQLESCKANKLQTNLHLKKD